MPLAEKGSYGKINLRTFLVRLDTEPADVNCLDLPSNEFRKQVKSILSLFTIRLEAATKCTDVGGQDLCGPWTFRGRLPEPFDVSSKTLCRILALSSPGAQSADLAS